MFKSADLPPNGPLSMDIILHFGHALRRTANVYKDLMRAVLEAIQNSLDANSSKINVNINHKTCRIIIQDDGDGASIERMKRALSRIGLTQKERGKLGQFGIGVVASHGKCRQFSFTSEPKDGSNGLMGWIFNQKALSKASIKGTVPCVPRVRHENQWWNSELFIEDFVPGTLKTNVKFDDLYRAIYDRFGKAMRKSGTHIELKVTPKVGTPREETLKPKQFQGTAQPIKTSTGANCGTTTIRIYVVDGGKPARGRAKKKGLGVTVVDAGGLFSLPLKPSLFPGGSPYLISKEVCDILNKGPFEGEICVGKGVTLDDSRDFFNPDEALLETVIHINEWANNEGATIVGKLSDKAQDERYRKSGQAVLKDFFKTLKQDGNKTLAEFIEKFKWGSQGKGHTPNTAQKGGTFRATATGGSGNKNGNKNGKKKPNKKKPVKKRGENPGHKPGVVVNPDGSKRVRVRDDSTGLTIDFDPSLGDDLWDMDLVAGVISFNTVHPTWVRMDEIHGTARRARDRRIDRLQADIISDVLTTLKKFSYWTNSLTEEAKFIIWGIIVDCVNTRSFMAVEADRHAATSPAKKESA